MAIITIIIILLLSSCLGPGFTKFQRRFLRIRKSNFASFPLLLLVEFQKIEKNFAELHSKLIITVFTRVFLEPKNKFFLFLGKNFCEKLIFYLRIFFQVRYGCHEKFVLNLF